MNFYRQSDVKFRREFFKVSGRLNGNYAYTTLFPKSTNDRSRIHWEAAGYSLIAARAPYKAPGPFTVCLGLATTAGIIFR